MSNFFPLPPGTILLIALGLGTAQTHPHSPGMTLRTLFEQTHGDREIKEYLFRVADVPFGKRRAVDVDTEVFDNQLVTICPTRVMA